MSLEWFAVLAARLETIGKCLTPATSITAEWTTMNLTLTLNAGNVIATATRKIVKEGEVARPLSTQKLRDAHAELENHSPECEKKCLLSVLEQFIPDN